MTGYVVGPPEASWRHGHRHDQVQSKDHRGPSGLLCDISSSMFTSLAQPMPKMRQLYMSLCLNWRLILKAALLNSSKIWIP